MDVKAGNADNWERIPEKRTCLTSGPIRPTIHYNNVNRFHLGFFVRSFVSSILIGLILVCPLLCQAAQVDDACADGGQTTNSPFEEPEGPVPCPEDGVSCICAGAVHSVDLRSGVLAPELLPNLDDWSLFSVVLPIPLAHLHLPGDGAQPDWAPWGAPQRVHALTQHYRC